MSICVVLVMIISAAEALSESRHFVLLLIFYNCNHVMFRFSRHSLLVLPFFIGGGESVNHSWHMQDGPPPLSQVSTSCTKMYWYE
jgi:hypothetical protein